MLLHAEIRHCKAILWGFVPSLQQQSCSYKADCYPKLLVMLGWVLLLHNHAKISVVLFIHPPSWCSWHGCAGEKEIFTYFCLCCGWPQSVLQPEFCCWLQSGWHGNGTLPSCRKVIQGSAPPNIFLEHFAFNLLLSKCCVGWIFMALPPTFSQDRCFSRLYHFLWNSVFDAGTAK